MTHRTAPDQTETRMPKGVPYIIGNELAERFSFYGMNAILTVFTTQHLLNAAGEPDYFSNEEAKGVGHLFKAAAYVTPIIGAVVADAFWGKYKTILLISLMYCVGHGALALMDLGPVTGLWDMKPFLFLGLALIAIGAGGIKPCVSAHVGDQFGRGNKHLLPQIFSWFYFSINTGAFASTLLTPVLLDKFGPAVAFGVPGVLMGLATTLFWLGRNHFVHVPAAGWARFKTETFSPEGKRALLNLAPLFLVFVAVFWMIFDQTATAWVLQAESMDRWVSFDAVGVDVEFEVLSSQLQAANPLLILLLIPIFSFWVYPGINRVWKLSPLRKIGIGLFVCLLSVVGSALIESAIQARTPEASAALRVALQGQGVEAAGDLPNIVQAARNAGWTNDQIRPFLDGMPHVGWQVLAYLVLTAAEIMVSIVCLEFAYTQSPRKMKSFIMGVYFLGVSVGNAFVSALNFLLEQFKDETTGAMPLAGASYYWFFAGLMGLAWLTYLVWARSYKGQTYIQGEDEAIAGAAAIAEAPDAR